VILARVTFIPLPPGSEPGFDHADIYRRRSPAASRLYVAHTGADRIDVIDCLTNSYLGSLTDVPGVAGVLIDSEQDFLFSSDRGCARVSIYRCSDETLLGHVRVGDRPNGLAYDPARHRLFVFNIGDPPGVNCTASVVAVDEMRVIATIPLPGRPRWAVYDAATEHIYANVRTPAQIVVLSAIDLRITRAFNVPVAGPHGLVIAGERLFCAADGGALVVLHRDTGAVLGSVALPGEPDVVMHDPASACLYVAIGSPGVVSVIDEQRLETLETVETESEPIPLAGMRTPVHCMRFCRPAGVPWYSLNSETAKGGEMATSRVESAERLHDERNSVENKIGLWPLTGYFLKLGTVGFGGPVALVGFMHRDLVEKRRWITEDTYKLSLALAQIMPGPLAAQVAIAIGYFEGGILGATLGGLAFVIPSFLMVVAISMAYVAYGGLWWMQALFYAIGATVIAIIAIAAYKLSRSTNKRDPLLWGIFALLTVVTVWAQAELAEFFILAGLVVLLVRAWPGWKRGILMALGGAVLGLAIWLLEAWLRQAGTAADSTDVLAQILLFFTKAGAFVFGSGLAIIPFLQQGVVQQFGWLNEHQFLDAVAVAMITPGPVVITVAFIGFLVAGFAGAVMASIGIFLPVYLFTIIPAPWFKRHRDNRQLKAFVDGATASATGAITGAVILLGARAITDLPTAVIGLISLAVLWRYKLPEPVIVTISGVIGLILWPLIRAG